MATRIGKAVNKAIAERKRKAAMKKAMQALKVAGQAIAALGAVAGLAAGATVAVKVKRMTPAQRRSARAKVRRALRLKKK